jgi:type VI secretion system secreted protein VgrG
MAKLSTAAHPLRVSTPVDQDRPLTLLAFTGKEAISQLFHFHLDVLDENPGDLPFEKLLGQGIGFFLQERLFTGIVARIGQGLRVQPPGEGPSTRYRIEVVPSVWLLTKVFQSRVFQQQSVKQILEKVFKGFKVDFTGLKGKYLPRQYCVQYRETDFNFACRLMEEEGIFYFFRHTDQGDQLVLADTPAEQAGQVHPDLPTEPRTLMFGVTRSGARSREDSVQSWEKVQELRSGKYTLWDHCFQLPRPPGFQNLQAQDTLANHKIKAGTADHTLEVAGNTALEVYDFPGGYAKRFDELEKGGAPAPGDQDLSNIPAAGKRAAEVRMQAEATPSLVILGTSRFRHLLSGHKFTLSRADHLNANGPYLLTSVGHSASMADNTSSGDGQAAGRLVYNNSFTCIPVHPDFPFRPPRVTPKPVVQGVQTATVVGSGGAGEEIHTDKYGRVKVQFHWDRAGDHNARPDQGTFKDSSCWVRVGTPWAGKQWGMIHIPRIGQEVIVDFVEGDPDQPIIVGSVYNAENMPPYKLPDHKTQSGVKSRSSLRGTPDNFNEIRFEDLKGKEQIVIHAERDMATSVEVDHSLSVGNNHSATIGTDSKGDPKKNGKSTTTIFGDTKITITKGDYSFTVAAGKADITVKGPVTEVFQNTQKTTVTNGIDITSESNHIHLTAPQEIVLTVKGSSITIKPDSIVLKSAEIHFDGGTKVTGKAPNIGFEGTTDFKAKAPTVIIDGTTEATYQGGVVNVTGKSKMTAGVGGQTVMCDSGKVAVSGAMIQSAAQGNHEITGALVKIN